MLFFTCTTLRCKSHHVVNIGKEPDCHRQIRGLIAVLQGEWLASGLVPQTGSEENEILED